MYSQVEEIKAKLSVEEVIGGYLQLQKAGRNLKACCPFHNEKSPSFMVSPERQFWYCFGCNEGGDIFTFLMKIEGIKFVDALKILGDRAGVEVRYKNVSRWGVEQPPEGNLLGVLEASKKFYQHCLKIKNGRKAYEYLLERGLDDEIIQHFELGFAPDSWNLLSDYLKKKGFSEVEIFGAGMTVKKDDGGFYDRFRGRIMFPVMGVSGQVLGFGSRVMPGGDEKSAKYINTPETLVYNKGRILYGLDKAKMFIRSADECIMVEGNMDVIASHQAGVKNVVAASGTALTIDQIRIIKRYTNNLVFSFDTDSAGVKAANRAIILALEEGMNVQIIQVAEGKDPADCVKRDPKIWQEAVLHKTKIMDFYFDSTLKKYDSNEIEGKKKITDELLEVIVKIPNRIEKSIYLQKLATIVGVTEEVLQRIIDEQKQVNHGTVMSGADVPKNETQPSVPSREYRLQERLLGFVIVYPEYFKENLLDLESLFSDTALLTIYQEIVKGFHKNSKINDEVLEGVLLFLNEQDECNHNHNLIQVYNAAAFAVEGYEDGGFNILTDIQECMIELRKILINSQLQNITSKIIEARRLGDVDLENKFLQEQSALMQKKSEF